MDIQIILIKAAQLIASLAFLVTIHEFGHFIPARIFKTKVEKFYLFFNPWFSIFRYRKVNGTKRFSWFTKETPKDWEDGSDKTEWGIGWLPLGGYVKIAGMIDESMDKDQMAQPAKPYEFRTKKPWQRLIIMIGGVTVNLIAGFIIYGAIAWYWGGAELNTANLKSGMAIHPYLAKYDVVSGDLITKVNGDEVTSFDDINRGLLLRNKTILSLVRDGKTLERKLPEGIDQELFQNGAMSIATFRALSNGVESIISGGLAEKAGLKKGDRLLTIDGDMVTYFDDIQTALYAKRSKKAALLVLRGTDTVLIQTKVTAEGTIGFGAQNKFTEDTLALTKVSYSIGESMSKGIFGGTQLLRDYVAQFKFVFTKKGATSVGGFTRIGDMFAPVWDWKVFWFNTAFLSFALAFMNILPIPALDGGHVVFLLYEWITGKEAPQKILETAQYVGFFLLLGLMIYANGNDLIQLVFK
jgi:regulator of sigma E protease